jgi:hypothetical protein
MKETEFLSMGYYGTLTKTTIFQKPLTTQSHDGLLTVGNQIVSWSFLSQHFF